MSLQMKDKKIVRALILCLCHGRVYVIKNAISMPLFTIKRCVQCQKIKISLAGLTNTDQLLPDVIHAHNCFFLFNPFFFIHVSQGLTRAGREFQIVRGVEC